MKIQDWWYAICVCRKYGIKWNPFSKIDSGSYLWSGWVQVNPFDPNFLTIFMHEVGHHVHGRRVDLESYYKPSNGELRFTGCKLSGRSIYKTLDSEALASRFALKTRKADRKYLIKAFNTYTSAIFSLMPSACVVDKFSDIVDCVYKNSRRIEK